MFDVSDQELEKDTVSFSHQPDSIFRWIAAGVMCVALVAAGWFYVQNRQQTAQEAAAPVQTSTAAADRPLGATADPIALPALDETDSLVRTLAAALSSHPLLASWLATDQVIRRFTVIVDNIATGWTPVRQLNEVRPAGGFRVTQSRGELRIDPRSYERYAPLAAAVDSVDAARAAQLYSMLKPRIEEAYVELGREGSFDRALEQAIVAVLQPAPLRGDETLAPTGIVFGFEDPRLERLAPAQKHLLRMGPDHATRVQSKVREIGLALGIPLDRLPR
jgi:hypothetical protein